MALNAYPFESANTTEDQYTKLFRNFADTGIVGSRGDDQFLVTTNGSGLDVQVSAGYAIIRGHAVENDAPVTVTLDTADPSNPRIDRIVLRLDPDADGINLVALKGTPGSNPSAPPLVQTDVDVYDLPVAQVRVSSGALNVTPDNITSERVWGSHRFGVWSTAGRPSAPRVGQPGFNVTTGAAEVWSGTSWESVNAKKKFVVPHTFTLAGHVNTANATGDYRVPAFFVPQNSGQKVTIVGARSVIYDGAGNSAVDFTLTSLSVIKNGPATATKTHLTARATKFVTTHSISSDLTGWDDVILTVTGLVADPKNLSVTVFLEYEV